MEILLYGVEGKAWEKVGDNQVKLLSGYKANQHMSAWNTGNNMILYTQDTITEKQVQERDESIEKAKTSPILGFNAKTDKVKTQLSNIMNVMNRYKANLNTGSIDPETTIPELVKELKQAGWDDVQKDIQKQLDEFIENSK